MEGSAKLIVVVADKAYERVLNEILARHQEAGFRPVDRRIVPDPFHDSSRKLTELLRPYLREYEHALVFRDLAGSGFEARGARSLEEDLEAQMLVSFVQSVAAGSTGVVSSEFGVAGHRRARLRQPTRPAPKPASCDCRAHPLPCILRP